MHGKARPAWRLSLQARSIKARLPPFVDILAAIGTCLALWLGVRLVLSGSLSAGALLVFVVYIGKMYKPMKDLSKMADTWSKAVIGFERIAEILSIESQVRRSARGSLRRQRSKDASSSLACASAMFRTSPVLDGLSLVVEPGQRAALVGVTGSGKSTLIALIARMYQVNEGRVLVDGSDIRSYTLDSLRRQVSFVLQEAVLFHTTVAQNISYGRPGATREEIVRAARLAHADEFIAGCPSVTTP